MKKIFLTFGAALLLAGCAGGPVKMDPAEFAKGESLYILKPLGKPLTPAQALIHLECWMENNAWRWRAIDAEGQIMAVSIRAWPTQDELHADFHKFITAFAP